MGKSAAAFAGALILVAGCAAPPERRASTQRSMYDDLVTVTIDNEDEETRKLRKGSFPSLFIGMDYQHLRDLLREAYPWVTVAHRTRTVDSLTITFAVERGSGRYSGYRYVTIVVDETGSIIGYSL